MGGGADGPADVVAGQERELLFRRFADRYPQLARYQSRTSREIPVVTVHRRG